MSNPAYAVDQVLYLKESAASGFLEAVVINSITSGPNGWLYSWRAMGSPLQIQSYGDRRSFGGAGKVLYLTEGELISKCEALALVRSSLQTKIDNIDRMIQNQCE